MKAVAVFFFLSTLVAYSQTDNITLMTYNLMYYRASSIPCTQSQGATTRDQELKTIFDYVHPTIFTANEVGASASNQNFILNSVINTQGEVNYAKANYTNNSFSDISNMLVYDSTKVMLKNQYFLSKDLNNNSLVRGIDFYHMYYKDPKLSMGADTVFFTVVCCHLKAGTGTSNENERETMAAAIMSHIANDVNDQNIILCGDMNVYASSEGAYQDFVNYSNVSARLYDPLNMPGSWHSTSQFADYHTQSTHSSGTGCYSGGGLDDWFDHYLVSNAVKQGTDGVTYDLNSYQVIGNDGNHFNQSINSGTNTAAPSNIVDALYNLSDHLPVIMKLKIDLSDIGLKEHSLAENFHVNNLITDNKLFISKSYNDEVNCKIYDLTGKIISRFTIGTDQASIVVNTNGWAPGIYIMRAKGNTGKPYSIKLVKN